MSKSEHFRHIILFAKGHYDIVDDTHYWRVLKEIISDYNGHDVDRILDMFIYEITSNAVKHFLNIPFHKWNDYYFEKLRFYPNETPLRLMILTNLGYLAHMSVDDVGGSWDFLDQKNLLTIKAVN